jgi:hypothetical protein
MNVKMLVLGLSLLAALSLSAKQKKNNCSVSSENGHWNFEISTYKTDVSRESATSGKFTMYVNCTGILNGFEVLEGDYSATLTSQTEALLSSDVTGTYKGKTLRIVSTAQVNIATGSYTLQEITVTLTSKNGKEITSDNTKVEGSFNPYDMTFQSLVSVASGSFERSKGKSEWAHSNQNNRH